MYRVCKPCRCVIIVEIKACITLPIFYHNLMNTAMRNGVNTLRPSDLASTERRVTLAES